MKFRLLVYFLSKLLGVARDEEAPRPDVYLPDFLLAFGSVLVVVGLACGVGFVWKRALWALIVAILGLVLGIAAVLCWRNQKIWVVSDEVFTYTTFLGNTHTYRFDQITGLRRNSDSLTIFVAGKKVHLESMALISDRFADLVNRALENNKEV